MRPEIVAEISANHGGSLDTALELVEQCAEAGAHAIKLQTWTPDKMVLDPKLVIQDGPWKGRSMVELYREAHTPWEWHKPIFDFAKAKGMDAFSSVFDLEALEFLESIGCPRYKIASFEMKDTRLIWEVAKKGKPMIISTGMAAEDDIALAYGATWEERITDLTFLKCTSSYPAPPSSINLHCMNRFGWQGIKYGLSDHTTGIAVAIAAVALGATMIEKHVTLGGDTLDAGFSVTPKTLRKLAAGCFAAYEALGDGVWRQNPAEDAQRALRRSLYASQDIPAGGVLTAENMTTARPALGMCASQYFKVLNLKVNTAIKAGSPLTANMVN